MWQRMFNLRVTWLLSQQLFAVLSSLEKSGNYPILYMWQTHDWLGLPRISRERESEPSRAVTQHISLIILVQFRITQLHMNTQRCLELHNINQYNKLWWFKIDWEYNYSQIQAYNHWIMFHYSKNQCRDSEPEIQRFMHLNSPVSLSGGQQDKWSSPGCLWHHWYSN